MQIFDEFLAGKTIAENCNKNVAFGGENLGNFGQGSAGRAGRLALEPGATVLRVSPYPPTPEYPPKQTKLHMDHSKR